MSSGPLGGLTVEEWGLKILPLVGSNPSNLFDRG